MNAVQEKAAEWFARVRSGDAEAHESLAQWKAADPAHEVVYAELENAWAAAGKAAGHEAVRAMRSAALSSIEPEKPARLRYWAIAATVLLAIGAAYAWLGFKGPPGYASYSTAVGERSTIALDDGSTVVLNTATRLRVSFINATRNVTLLTGQALFDVEKDSRRPFVVQAGDRRITAIGTSFDVRLDADDVRVTLLEGRVAVEEARVPAHREELAPGQQLLARAKSAPVVRSADVGRVTSWREGRLIFENEPLSGVVAEVNRYSQRKVALGDPALGELRLSGTFRTGSPVTFVAALREYFPIEAGEEKGELVLKWRGPR